MKFFRTAIAILLLWYLLPSVVLADWPMAGHDPQRTSFAPEDTFSPATTLRWARQMPDYIPSKAHIITSSETNLLYVPTGSGVFALNPSDGSTRWHYATPLPAGHSPTYANGVLYIPSLDHTIHAVNATTGAKIWQTKMAGSGFYVSPLVVRNKVYAGNRDGFFYSFDAQTGNLVWYYEVGEPISYSAAYQTYTDQPNGVIYFGAMDARAYALKAEDANADGKGDLLWRSAPLAGDGFAAFWPMAVQDRVIFVTGNNYPMGDSLEQVQKRDVPLLGVSTSVVQSKMNAQGHIDFQYILDYLNNYPHRQTVHVINRTNGQKAETAPFLWWNNPSGNRYPPALGPDGRIYMSTPWWEGWYFGAGRYAGWQIGSKWINPVPYATDYHESADEPEGHSIIGNNSLYYNRGGDGQDGGGVFLLSHSNAGGWWYLSLGNYAQGYEQYKYGNHIPAGDPPNYGTHGLQNPPVPLNGNVYFHRSNAVVSMRP